MYTYLLFISTIIVLSTFFFKNNFYLKWKKLNSLVSVNNKNKFLIYWNSIKLLSTLLWISLLQRMNNTVVKINKNTYEITYIVEGKMYKLVTHVKRGPAPILQIISDEENDVTRQILQYLGPDYNCCSNDLEPSFFGYNTLFFEFGDGTNKLYKTGESIKKCIDI